VVLRFVSQNLARTRVWNLESFSEQALEGTAYLWFGKGYVFAAMLAFLTHAAYIGSCNWSCERIWRRRYDRISCPLRRKPQSERRHRYQLAKMDHRITEYDDIFGWAHSADYYPRYVQARANGLFDQSHFGESYLKAPLLSYGRFNLPCLFLFLQLLFIAVMYLVDQINLLPSTWSLSPDPRSLVYYFW